jgi:hypothetical protein
VNEPVTKPPSVAATTRRPPWTSILAAPFALAAALLLFRSLHAQAAPAWVGAVAAVAVFPILPLAWHILAERRTAARLPLLDRFALRTLALAVLVLGVSLTTLGPRRVGSELTWFAHRAPHPAAPSATPPPGDHPPAPPARNELEAFIPPDARMVVALSDARLAQQFLTPDGLDSKRTLAALEKCQISIDHAALLIATRGHDARLVAVRAPGITDQRNLYCLVGFLGGDRLRVRVTSDSGPLRFDVEGLPSGPLKFKAIEDGTILAAEGAWAEAADKPPARTATDKPPVDRSAPLGTVLTRVDRSASLWSASIAGSDQHRWDLALDARFDGPDFKLRGSSIPPSGPGDRAEVQLRLPAGFTSALPPGTVRDALRSTLAALATLAATH